MDIAHETVNFFKPTIYPLLAIRATAATPTHLLWPSAASAASTYLLWPAVISKLIQLICVVGAVVGEVDLWDGVLKVIIGLPVQVLAHPGV